jgi:hypothetical protein
MTPVIILADMSRSFAPEAIEARGMFLNEHSTGIAKDMSSFQLHSRGRGGIIVEALGVATSTANFGCYVQVQPTTGAGMGAAFAQPNNIGGEAISSFLMDSTVFDPPGTGVIYPSPLVLPTERMFVPAGYYLRWGVYSWVAPAIHDIATNLVFREIPESLGAP